MNGKEKTRLLLTEHFEKYPLLQLRDVFKFLHQSSFGCEHLVSSEEKAVEYIKEEYDNCAEKKKILIEKLDGGYSRVHLSCIGCGLSAEALGKYFTLSAKTEADGEKKLKEKLSAAEELVREGILPFSLKDFEREKDRWEEKGFSPVRHSEIFREAYKPAYRVVSDEYAEIISELIRRE